MIMVPNHLVYLWEVTLY